MDILNMVFTGLFTVEMVLKIIAFKPKVPPIRPNPFLRVELIAYLSGGTSLIAQSVKNLPAMQETWV